MRISVCESLPTSPDLRKLAKERGEEVWVTLGRLVYIFAYITRQTTHKKPITSVTDQELGVQLMNDPEIVRQLIDCGYLIEYETGDDDSAKTGIDTSETNDLIYTVIPDGEP